MSEDPKGCTNCGFTSYELEGGKCDECQSGEPMSARIETVIADITARIAYTHRAMPGKCTCGERLPAPRDASHARHLGQFVATEVDAALKAARIAVIELAETQTDPEWGDEYWAVPVANDKHPGKLRIDTGYKSGPRIAITSVRYPIPAADVDAYVSALLAAKAAVIGAHITVEEA